MANAASSLQWWCYGLPWEEVGRRARLWKGEGWQPDEVWVTTLTSFWWRGAHEVIRRVRYDWWPQARVVLGGLYPTLYPAHAAARTEADIVVTGSIPEAADRVADLALYGKTLRTCAGVHLWRGPGSPQSVVNQIAANARLGVREMAFFDERIPGPDPSLFDYVLEGVNRLPFRIRFVALGNLAARDVTTYRASLMHAAGFTEVYLSDDAIAALDGDMQPYLEAARLLQTFGGLKPRDGSLSAIAIAGRPGENLEDTARRMIYLAHIVGSVTVFPYQPTPEEGHRLGVGEPDLVNGKLFPFAASNGVRFEDYTELLRLAATLNSKYRDVTFDFLGEDLVARLVRESIRSNGWNAKAAVGANRDLPRLNR